MIQIRESFIKRMRVFVTKKRRGIRVGNKDNDGLDTVIRHNAVVGHGPLEMSFVLVLVIENKAIGRSQSQT